MHPIRDREQATPGLNFSRFGQFSLSLSLSLSLSTPPPTLNSICASVCLFVSAQPPISYDSSPIVWSGQIHRHTIRVIFPSFYLSSASPSFAQACAEIDVGNHVTLHCSVAPPVGETVMSRCVCLCVCVCDSVCVCVCCCFWICCVCVCVCVCV